MDENFKSTEAILDFEAMLESKGINLEDPNFSHTSERWIKYLMSYIQPYDPGEDLKKCFDAPEGGKYEHAMVVQCNIPYRAICAHHFLPVLGIAHIGYIPHKKIVGLSKLTRLVYGLTHEMPSLQENICNKITHMIGRHLECLGSMCVISAEHGCMAARGVQEVGIKTVTSSVRGVFTMKHETRAEFLNLIKINS